jgi:endonuclease/exonuclease/phosphatase family metal-dependent hydrolase
MPELVKTAQWNIGGGKIRNPEADPASPQSYIDDGLETIIDTLEQQNPDIITLQETHEADGYCQPAIIAEALGYQSWVNDQYGESHIDPRYRLGQAIISRFPFDEHDFRFFLNPEYTAEWATRTHDKGVTTVKVQLGSRATFWAQTLHAVPFRAFGVEETSEEAKPVLKDMQAKVLNTKNSPRILQGDFNLDSASLRKLMPELFEAEFDEIEQHSITTPRARRYDHILFSGMRAVGSCVIGDQLTDHYPVIANLSTA